ncbi:hypothetical protein AGABI2DRAFT_135062 [Agaricus bisporus var. bisporus H97]|uniref:hypothetical protein n=1 Tax=Agaricus bisporus var. bisporus (strain H97 / ATCC MYA-4626 / FGSC 10389) TaxID=936046 RepID=UPI00029F4ED5|nr:hypothetical protein AGABI2DRAFT_135062 [Agaricus bisporus var. bisporus H97]EKV49635.1 hypothetical protein AGABI2DRAFT_135062 [Agaricus bisporus var. bisporus H97]
MERQSQAAQKATDSSPSGRFLRSSVSRGRAGHRHTSAHNDEPVTTNENETYFISTPEIELKQPISRVYKQRLFRSSKLHRLQTSNLGRRPIVGQQDSIR